jgi:putative SOS response-associated peptidase YedK
MFRSAFKRNRRIISASGYFEWKTMPDGNQLYFISAADSGLLSIAGLWDRWQSTDAAGTALSCTMIVTDAHALTRSVHTCMPVLLGRADIKSWLAGRNGAAQAGGRRSLSHVAGIPPHKPDRRPQ